MGVRRAATVAGLALGLISGAAKADLLHFEVQDPSEPLSFNLDSMPSPLAGDAQSFSVRASDRAVYLGQPVPYFDLVFFTSSGGGGFWNEYFPGGPLAEIVPGDQLFSGSTAHPVFAPGTYTVFDQLDEPVALIISGVPLPASAPLFGSALLALGAVGYGLRRKKAVLA